MEWQPLSTAPATRPDEESPRVLLWMLDAGKDGKGMAVIGCCYRSFDGSVVGSVPGFHGFKCSRWMPLPAAP